MLIRDQFNAASNDKWKEALSLVLPQSGFDPLKSKVRLNWGSPETPELVLSDLIYAAELGLIQTEEFRKNAVKFGWELWDAPKGQEGSKASQEVMS